MEFKSDAGQAKIECQHILYYVEKDLIVYICPQHIPDLVYFKVKLNLKFKSFVNQFLLIPY